MQTFQNVGKAKKDKIKGAVNPIWKITRKIIDYVWWDCFGGLPTYPVRFFLHFFLWIGFSAKMVGLCVSMVKILTSFSIEQGSEKKTEQN